MTATSGWSSSAACAQVVSHSAQKGLLGPSAVLSRIVPPRTIEQPSSTPPSTRTPSPDSLKAIARPNPVRSAVESPNMATRGGAVVPGGVVAPTDCSAIRASSEA